LRRALAAPNFSASDALPAARDARDDLLRQANRAHALGSAFVAEVLAAAHRQLSRAPRLDALIAGWRGDPASGAMALRLNAGLHALARAGQPAALGRLYAELDGDFDGAIAQAFDAHEPALLRWMAHPTQTNEVGRSVALHAALGTLAARHPGAFELLELGASAGLNLNLAHYAHRIGGQWRGQTGSSVRVGPDWRGAVPPDRPVAIASARGVDLDPLDLADPQTRERLLAYVWAGDTARMRRLESAIALARHHPPHVERGSAAPWLAQRLAAPQDAGTTRVVFHSMVMQYLADDERRAVISGIMQAGARATPDRPLAWIGFEWRADRSEVALQMIAWPHGTHAASAQTLATCHPYGSWVDWRA
jgi:hypothetical protein